MLYILQCIFNEEEQQPTGLLGGYNSITLAKQSARQPLSPFTNQYLRAAAPTKWNKAFRWKPDVWHFSNVTHPIKLIYSMYALRVNTKLHVHQQTEHLPALKNFYAGVGVGETRKPISREGTTMFHQKFPSKFPMFFYLIGTLHRVNFLLQPLRSNSLCFVQLSHDDAKLKTRKLDKKRQGLEGSVDYSWPSSCTSRHC